jgi:hypothetical protein
MIPVEKTLDAGISVSCGDRCRCCLADKRRARNIFLCCLARSRISADRAPHLIGTASLGNWRGSRLQAVYRGTEIGTKVGKYWASFPGLRSPGAVRGQAASFAGFGSRGLVRRAWHAPLLMHMAEERTIRHQSVYIGSQVSGGSFFRLPLFLMNCLRAHIKVVAFGCR